MLEHADKWFTTVMNGGNAKEQSSFFLYEEPRIFVMPSGISIGMEAHFQLHQHWINEEHKNATFLITELSQSPERVRASGSVYWQAEIPNQNPPNIIRAVVGEDWILEKDSTGLLKFVLYMNTFHHLLPDSAPLIL